MNVKLRDCDNENVYLDFRWKVCVNVDNNEPRKDKSEDNFDKCLDYLVIILKKNIILAMLCMLMNVMVNVVVLLEKRWMEIKNN